MFIDYSDALWSAQVLSLGENTQELEPCALAMAACDELAASGEEAVRLVEVRVYVSKPRESQRKYMRRRSRWEDDGRGRGIRVTVQDPSANERGEAKEVHTQLTVDLLKWADSVARNRSGSDIAVLFSNDRDCRPGVLKARERIVAEQRARVDIAVWAGQEDSDLDWEWIATLDTEVRAHFVDWDNYEACKAQTTDAPRRSHRRVRRIRRTPTSTTVDGSTRAVLFIDYENARWAASELFFDKSPGAGHFHPRKLAAVIRDRYNQSVRPSDAPELEIAEVRVYRGIPDRERENLRYIDRVYREQAWTDPSEHARLEDQGPEVEVIGSPIQYPDLDVPRPSERERANVVEKEVDTAIAADMVAMALDGQFDVAIMFSEDRDMRPPVYAVLDRDLSGKTISVHRVGWGFDRDERILGISKTDLSDDAYSPEYPLWLDHYETSADDTNYLQLACKRYRQNDILTVEVVDRNPEGFIVAVDEHVLGFVFRDQLVSIDSDREQPTTRLEEARSNHALTVAIQRIQTTDPRRLLIRLSECLATAWGRLDEVHDSGEVVDGRVTGSNKGGLAVSIEGVEHINAFVPLRQIVGLASERELAITQLDEYEGRSLRLRVLEIDRSHNRVVLSERTAVQEEWDQVIAPYEVGQIVVSTVTRLVDFGAFARLEVPVEGLVHISELADRRITHPREVVTENDVIPVKIVRIERDRHRLGLSLRQARTDAERAGWMFDEGGRIARLPDELAAELGVEQD